VRGQPFGIPYYFTTIPLYNFWVMMRCREFPIFIILYVILGRIILLSWLIVLESEGLIALKPAGDIDPANQEWPTLTTEDRSQIKLSISTSIEVHLYQCIQK
jgi:hypothetical protein